MDGQLHDAIEGPGTPVLDLRPITSLRGAHNWQNAAAAYGAVRALGLAPEAIAAGLPHFQGLAHRLEPVATLDGVQFVNDSKATNPDAAARALASFEDIYWIAGGRPKDAGLDPVLPWLDRVRHAYLIGEAAGAVRRGRSRTASPAPRAAISPTALAPGAPKRRGGGSPAASRWFCWRRPAPRSTSSAISRSAARPSRRWSPSSQRRPGEREASRS